MTLREKVDEWARARRAVLVKAHNRGLHVWGIRVPPHDGRHPLGHRRTLTDGTPVYTWAGTLHELAMDLEIVEAPPGFVAPADREDYQARVAPIVHEAALGDPGEEGEEVRDA